MPDPDFQTISSSQVPELLNTSSWGTRKTLHVQFQRRLYEDRTQTGRMRLGKIFQPYALQLIAEKLALDVLPNEKDEFVRHPDPAIRLGCTIDGDVICPTRGRGTVEVKAIDKWAWERDWTATAAPVMYEIQLQEQMCVKEHTWGVIGALIYNDGPDGRLEVYERRPNEEVYEKLITESSAFFADLAAGRAPPAFGLPVEMEALAYLYPELDPKKVIAAADNVDMAEIARMFDWARRQESSFKKVQKELQPRLVDFMQDAVRANLAGGVAVELGKSQVAGQVVMLPAELRKRLAALAKFLDEETIYDSAVVIEAMEWCQILRQPSITNRIKVTDPEMDMPSDFDRPSTLEAG